MTYSYDNTNQLTGADRSGTTNDETYGYDENGNRTTGGFTVTSDNRYSSVTIDGVVYTLTYDDEGNLTKKTNNSTGAYTDYLYDHRNRLYQVDEKTSGGTLQKQSIYTYDSFDRRVIKSYDPDGAGSTVPTLTKWLYDGQNPVLEFTKYDPAGTTSDVIDGLTHRYLYGNVVDQVLADERFTPANNSTNWLPSAPGTVLTPISDDQNTTRDLVNTSGVVQNHIEYNSFGRVTAESAATVDYLFGYTGFVRDEEFKIDWSNTRIYLSDLGRWGQQDPIGFAGGDANLYRQVGNSSPNGTDPSGLAAHGKFKVKFDSDPDGEGWFNTTVTTYWYPDAETACKRVVLRSTVRTQMRNYLGWTTDTGVHIDTSLQKGINWAYDPKEASSQTTSPGPGIEGARSDYAMIVDAAGFDTPWLGEWQNPRYLWQQFEVAAYDDSNRKLGESSKREIFGAVRIWVYAYPDHKVVSVNGGQDGRFVIWRDGPPINSVVTTDQFEPQPPSQQWIDLWNAAAFVNRWSTGDFYW